MTQINKKDIQLIGNLLVGKINDKPWDIAESSASVSYSEAEGSPTFIISYKEENSSCPIKKEFYYISNPDKTIRWIWPKGLKKPSYLNFYCANGIKSKAYASASRFLFEIGMESKLSSGSFIVESFDGSALDRLIRENGYFDFSIFLGTSGPNRKVLIECGEHGASKEFIKIPVGINAKKLILKEAIALNGIGTILNKNSTPEVLISSEDYLVQSNCTFPKSKRPQSFSDNQANFLKEVYLKNTSYIKPRDTRFIIEADERIKAISESVLKPELSDLYRRLKSVRTYLNVSSDIPMTMAHGDFTPWNMYENGEALYVYDWEMALESAPLFYDLFHFEFQKGILQDRKSFYSILNQIEKKINDPIFSRELNMYPVDWRELVKLYIYHISSYYLSVYQSQEHLHIQVEWLVKVWSEGLDWSASFVNQKLDRKKMTLNFFKYLNQQKVDYAWLKSRALPIAQLAEGSDIDILIRKENYKSIYKWLEMHPACSGIQELRQSFMSTLILFLNNGETLFIDLLWAFKRKNKTYLSASTVLENRIQSDENISIVSPKDDLEYCLNFYQQNGAGIPEHYLKYFSEHNLISEEENKTYKYFSPTIKRDLEKKALNFSENKGFSLLNNTGSYLKDIWTRIKGGRGMVISFSGVDGAGKSTVLENTKQLMEQRYRRNTIVLRHRPSFLPILSAYKYGKKEAEQRATDTLPRQGTNSSTLSSVLRFSYYYTDYLIGQWIIYIKYVMRGYVVLYDRYYFDFINDPKRANLNLSNTLPLMLSGFILKPDLNFLLTAPADVILERKQELTKPAIESLTKKYSEYFNGLSDSGQGKFILLENIDLARTMDTIEKHFKPALA